MVKHGMARTHEYQMWWCAKRSAKRRGIEFTLDPRDIIIPTTCPVLGIPITIRNGVIKPTSASIDRVDNSKGYTKENIRVISNRANLLKNSTTIEEVEKILAYMKENK